LLIRAGAEHLPSPRQQPISGLPEIEATQVGNSRPEMRQRQAYGRGRTEKQPARASEHDPEKWEPVFGKDHAQTESWSGMMIRRKIIPL
jgi:hypothetical protein